MMNSASVLDRVTKRCFFAFHVMGQSLIMTMWPPTEALVIRSVAKLASPYARRWRLVGFNLPPHLKPRLRVPEIYRQRWFRSCKCSLEGPWLASLSLIMV